MAAPSSTHRTAARAIGFAEPALSVWLVAAGIHGLHILHLRGVISSWAWTAPLLLLLLALDAAATIRFHLPAPGRPRAALVANALFWIAAYAFWVPGVGSLAERAPWLTFFGPWIHAHLWLVWRAQGWLTLVAAAACLAAYAVGTVRYRRARVLTGVVLPALATVALGAQLNVAGGAFPDDARAVEAQPGVTVALDPRSLAIPGAADFGWYPRDVCVDPASGAITAAYGCSWCLDDGASPSVVRWEPDTGELVARAGYNVHHIDCSGDPIWIAPWGATSSPLALDASDLEVVSELARPRRRQLDFFQPIQILRHPTAPRVFAGSEATAALVVWDTAEPDAPRVLELPASARLSRGGPLQHLAWSARTGMLYATAGPGDDLFEIDPDALTVQRSVDLGDVVGTALAVDDGAGVIYYQSGVRDALFRLNLATLEVEAEWESEIHARRLHVDRERGALYVLGFFSGTVFALDLATGARRWTVAVGPRPHGLAATEGALFVNSMVGVVRVDLAVVDQRP